MMRLPLPKAYVPALFLALLGLASVAADEPPTEPAADPAPATQADPQMERGRMIYNESCADCHGDQAQGVEGAYEDPLVGDDSTGQLAEYISETMPEGEPELCVGEDAEAVAAYLHYHFYSEAAQIRNRPPRIGLARLTADQLRQSLADLYEQFEGSPQPVETALQGVAGNYYDGSRYKRENRKIERVDPVIDFDFGHESPGEGIKAESFFINWEGGLVVETTGRYEIVVRSSCSFVMDFGRLDRQLIDNHVQSGDNTEFRRSLVLTAGRVYPFKIDFIQRERKTEIPPAHISLSWVPPGGVEEIVPNRNLVSRRPPPTFSLQTPLPPDDRSYGFERGVAINREWDESTTAAAIEFAQVAVDELWPAYLRSHRRDPGNDREKMRSFLTQIISSAFRRPLDDELTDLYITKQLQAEVDDALAIKRSLLVSLKSPRFLYPLADMDQSRSQQVANRLSLILYDSLPTSDSLLTAIAKGRFETEEDVRAFARQNLRDYRVQAKLREMLQEWLNIGQQLEISKQNSRFPGFESALVSDLRQSLNAFLDAVVWSETSDFRRLFQADFAFTSPRIAEFYGGPWQVEADDAAQKLQRIDYSEGNYGVLTHPYLMSALAYHDSTSPIHRGVFLIRYVLGRTLRPPAEAFSPLSPDLHPDLTTRERVELQTSPDSCQICHTKINGLGFTLENYDAVGRLRTEEQNKPINTAGSYTDRNGQMIEFANADELARYIVESPDAHRAFVARVFQHFVKQPPAAFGPHTLDNLVEKFQDSGFNVRELVVEVAVTAALHPPEDSQAALVAVK